MLTFSHVGDGIQAKSGVKKGFFISGPDNKFHLDQASMIGEEQAAVSGNRVP